MRECYFCENGWRDCADGEREFRERCHSCDGKGVASVRAGDRNTRPRAIVHCIAGQFRVGDLLCILRDIRRDLVGSKRRNSWRVAALEAAYRDARIKAMSRARITA